MRNWGNFKCRVPEPVCPSRMPRQQAIVSGVPEFAAPFHFLDAAIGQARDGQGSQNRLGRPVRRLRAVFKTKDYLSSNRVRELPGWRADPPFPFGRRPDRIGSLSLSFRPFEMSIRAIPVVAKRSGPPSWFRVETNRALEMTLLISDSSDGRPVNWAGQPARFRVYSPFVDQFVVVEVTDPQRCSLQPKGIWQLRLTEDETARLPHGGMIFTLEHRDPDTDFQLGIRGGISCYEIKPDPM